MTITPHYERDGVTVYQGDCLDVMRTFPDNCIDTVITDPPYGLSDQKGASLEDSIIDIFFDVVFPDYYNIYSQFKTDFHFSGPFDGIMFLNFMDRAIWKKSGITMPKCTIDFNTCIDTGNEKINNSGESPVSFSDRVLPNKINSKRSEFFGNYFLNIRPSVNSTFSNSRASGFRQLGLGCFSMPVVIPFNSDFAGFLCSLSPTNSGFVADVIRFLNSPESQPCPSGVVMASSGTEAVVVFSFDLGRGTFELFPADGASDNDFFFEFVTPKNIRTFSATGSLSTMFKSVSFGLVNDTANGAFSVYFHKDIITEINKTRKGFMGKNWDHGLPGEAYWREALRVAKPGATLLAFGGTRTYHRLTCAIEDAGWEIRDCIMWVYGSGFPKSHDVSKGIDKAAGAEREVVGETVRVDGRIPNNEKSHNLNGSLYKTGIIDSSNRNITTPATPLARTFSGYGSALKPAYEPIVVAMKPMGQSFAANAEEWGISGLWIDGARVEANGETIATSGELVDTSCHNGYDRPNSTMFRTGKSKERGGPAHPQGRWPANIIHDSSEAVEAEFAKAGVSVSSPAIGIKRFGRSGGIMGKVGNLRDGRPEGHSDSGSASRFFQQCPPDPLDHPEAARFHYCSKAGKKERGEYNNHPTVKPLSLLRYLAKLTKPPYAGVVLDPFGGSGTTALAARAEGRPVILIEKEPEYCDIIVNRLENKKDVPPVKAGKVEVVQAQMKLFD